ncbi:MAG: hypothetical protein KJP27_04925 [Altererythrobacter sp.]|nr:hypothetical protein [Altererythrobacter sp.]
MDWALVIRKNRAALLGIFALLFAQVGLVPPAGRAGRQDGPILLVPSVKRALLRLLHPAESAARRLIIIAAQGHSAPRSQAISTMPHFAEFQPSSRSKVPAFRLVDPRKRFGLRSARIFAKIGPRISVPGLVDARFEPVSQDRHADQKVNAAALIKRLDALHSALTDLPKQVRRLVRYRALMDKAARHQVKLAPLRPGLPPGYRRRRTRDVDDILFECDLLAREVLNPAPR